MAAPVITIEVKGLREVQRRLAEISRTISGNLQESLRAEGELIMTVAKQRTPVMTGTLRGSGHVQDVRDGIRLSFGGPAADYAVYVHERLDTHHPNGQAKFLESACLEAIPSLPDRVASRMLRRRG